MAASIDPEVQQLFSQNTAEDDSRQHNGNVYGGATYNNQSYFFVKPLGEGPWDSQRKLNDFWANFEALGINERKELLQNVPTAQVTKLGRMRSSTPFSLRGISVAQHYVQRKAELQMLHNFFLRDRLNCGTEDDPTLDASNGSIPSYTN